MLALPTYINTEYEGPLSAKDIDDGFRLTGFFLARHVLEPRGVTLPDARRISSRPYAVHFSDAASNRKRPVFQPAFLSALNYQISRTHVRFPAALIGIIARAAADIIAVTAIAVTAMITTAT